MNSFIDVINKCEGEKILREKLKATKTELVKVNAEMIDRNLKYKQHVQYLNHEVKSRIERKKSLDIFPMQILFTYIDDEQQWDKFIKDCKEKFVCHESKCNDLWAGECRNIHLTSWK